MRDEDFFIPSEGLSNYLDETPDRASALIFWGRIAAGEFDDYETSEFLKEVARRMIDADGETAGRGRDARIVAASGLAGHADRNRKLRQFLEGEAVSEALESIDSEDTPQSKISSRALVEKARAAGAIPKHLSDTNADRLIRDVRKTMGKSS